mmetsp:Transcript_88036/g.254122  ORF Transcript_88036/g.254122 Transcript_88036/m.254122 type:complete len:210 (-) Transcript_88036:59-688(-)
MKAAGLQVGLFLLACLTRTCLAVRALAPALDDGAKMDESGAFYYENGTKWLPFTDLPSSQALPRESFVCHNGAIFGLRLPAHGKHREEFVYLTPRKMPQFWPLQGYSDASDQTRSMLVVPPIDDNYRTWQLLWCPKVPRDQTELETANDGMKVFPIGEEHPCGPDGDWEALLQAATASRTSSGSMPTHIQRRAGRVLREMERLGRSQLP